MLAKGKIKGAKHRPPTRARDDGALRKSDVTRQRILDAAARVFSEQGYSGTRLTDIAARAGMKAGSLYYHFDSRETLIDAVMQVGTRRTHTAALEKLRALPANTPPLRKLEILIENHLLLGLEQSDYTTASIKLIWQVPDTIRERQLVEQRAYGALWRNVLEEARADGTIRSDLNLSAMRMMILGALNWATDWYKPKGDSPAQLAGDLIKMVLHGLAWRSTGDGDARRATVRAPKRPVRSSRPRSTKLSNRD